MAAATKKMGSLVGRLLALLAHQIILDRCNRCGSRVWVLLMGALRRFRMSARRPGIRDTLVNRVL